jgi:hypothetical protein
MERRQAETEAMHCREDDAERRARFEEVPIPTDDAGCELDPEYPPGWMS